MSPEILDHGDVVPKYVNWTPEMDERLVELNRARTKLKLIAMELNLGTSPVSHRLKVLATQGVIPTDEARRYKPRTKNTPRAPRGPDKWTQERLEEIARLWALGYSTTEIAHELQETPSAIRGQARLLRKRGELPSERKSRKRRKDTSRVFTQAMDHRLIELRGSGVSLVECAQLLGVTRSQIRARIGQLRRLGLMETLETMSARRVEQIARLYNEGLAVKQIAEALDSTPGSIGVALVRLRKKGLVGTRPRPYWSGSRASKPRVDVDKIVELATGGATTPDIAARVGCAQSTVRRHLRALRHKGVLPTRSSRERTWTPERVTRLKRLYRSDTPIEQIARELGVTTRAIGNKLHKLRKAGTLPPHTVRP